MKQKKDRIRGEAATERLLRIVIAVMMLLFMSFLVIYSLIQTGDKTIAVSESYGLGSSLPRDFENFIFNSDSIIINIIALAAGAMLCFIAIPRMKKLSYVKKQIIMMLWIIIIGCIWVHSAQSTPSHDSLAVANAGFHFAQNNFAWLDETDLYYFTRYPFQLGIVFLYEIVFRIFGLFSSEKTYMPLEYLNVGMLAISDVLIAAINRRIFRDRRVTDLTFWLLAFCAPAILNCNYTYGMIPGLMFALLAVYSLIHYYENNGLHWLLLTFLPAAIAVMLKSNCIIFSVAITTTIIAMMPKRKKYLMDIALAVSVMILSLFIPNGISFMYYERAGSMPRDALPFNTWINIGLTENPAGPGWYDTSCSTDIFFQNGLNESVTKSVMSDSIKKRLRYFARHPYYTRNFFSRKFLSQWNETSYQSIWNTQARPTNSDSRRGPLAEWICGPGEYPMKRYMDKYAQLIFVGVLAGVVSSFRRKRLLELFFPLVMLGGMLFHTMSEAKSEYAIPYFILMSGYAAFGICRLYDLSREKLGHKEWAKRLFLFGTPAAEPVPENIAAAPAAPDASGKKEEEKKTEPVTAAAKGKKTKKSSMKKK